MLNNHPVMAHIIAISLNGDMLEEIERAEREMGFSGRSEIIRAGVRMLLADGKERERLKGKINSVLVLIHDQRAEDAVTKIKHEFEDIIDTQIHNHLRQGRCLELFILEGDAERVRRLVNLFQTTRKMEYVKLIVA